MTHRLESTIRGMLDDVLLEVPFEGLGELYRGKVRDSFIREDGTRILVTTDRVSAFDHVIGTVPAKGQVLSTLAAWWFSRTGDVAPNHLLRVLDPAAQLVREAKPVMIEMVMRGYLTGTTDTSIWTHYEKGARTYCGHALPDGMRRHEKLPSPLLTPTTKAGRGQHDEPVSREEAIARGIVSAEDFDEAAALAHALFERGTAICAERGIILVDTKYELGRLPDGRMAVIDEIHTPDSSRFWRITGYEAAVAAGKDPEPLDKDYVRTYLKSVGYKGDGAPPALPDDVRVEAALRYVRAFETLTGSPFEPSTEPPLARLERALRAV